MAYALAAPPERFVPDTDFDQNEAETDVKYWSLERCKRAYLSYLGAKREEIDEQQAARCYRHGAQWTTQQVEVFNRRKQPVVTYNRIGRKIDSIVGLMERLKQDPKAYPRNPSTTDERAAELATAVVRNVLETELREKRLPFAIEMAAVDGIGGVAMSLEEGDHGDHDIGFTLVQTDSFFYDPRSYLHDFSDARYMGEGKWLSLDDAKELVPEKADELEGTVQSGWDLTSNPDRDRKWLIADKEARRIRVVEIWYKHENGWCWCLFTGFNKLAEGKGYFYNERGKAICRYIMFSSFIDHDADRYGFVRNLRSSQDEINQRRSKGLHELVSRRIKAEDGAFADVEVARREAVKPDGVVIYNKGFEMEFDDQVRLANVEGQLKFLEDAKNEIENFGPNPALIGQGLEYKSGRAINLLQQAGIAELGPFVLNIKDWKLRLYRAIWAAVQRYWTAERWVRVTNDEGIATYLQINGMGTDQYGIPRLVNNVGQLDVNFVLDEGPDEVNMMADAYDTLIALSSQGAKVPPEILIELSPVGASTKRKLLAILQRPDPVAEQAKQVALQGEAANVEETKSRSMLNIAKARESAQGGAHGIIERQMDMQQSQQEHGMKMTELAAKVETQRQQGAIKLQGEMARLHAERTKSAQDMQMNAMKNAQSLRHTEQQHEQRLRTQQAAAKQQQARQRQKVRPNGR